MPKMTNSYGWHILPAAQALFDKSKVTLEDISNEWKEGTVVICRKPNGKLHYVAGSQGNYGNIGDEKHCFHDQTHNLIGKWVIVNVVNYKVNSRGGLDLEYLATPNADNMTMKAPLHVFK